ncbi:ankyrin repeat protein [Nemania serpens]|nr:ankyrin repeat protein [Nemania serpens]
MRWRDACGSAECLHMQPITHLHLLPNYICLSSGVAVHRWPFEPFSYTSRSRLGQVNVSVSSLSCFFFFPSLLLYRRVINTHAAVLWLINKCLPRCGCAHCSEMASRDDYTVAWICAIPLEMAAAKAALDRIYPKLPADPSTEDATNTYVLGSLEGHNVVVACLPFGVHGTSSAAAAASRMLAGFRSIRFTLIVGVGGGVPCTQEDIRLGDVVVSKPTTARPGILRRDSGKECATDQLTMTGTLNKPSTLLLTAARKVEANAILGESQIPSNLSKIVKKDPLNFAHPGPEQDILFDAHYDHVAESIDDTCSHCDPGKIQNRPPRETQSPKVHYGLIASGDRAMRHGATRDTLAREHGILCFEMEPAGLMETAQCLVIRGICDYSDSHTSKRWQGYAAAAAAAYAKEILSLIPTAPRAGPRPFVPDSVVSAVRDALLLTRPDVDRSSLIALKGRRIDGTCEWLVRHPSYQEWLQGADPPLLWISGGPGKGKTMLAIYITEQLQQVVDYSQGVLLYYFCSNRDKNRNTAVTIMRGVLHQWLLLQPYLAQYIRNYFDGAETTKYTISNLAILLKLFLILLRRSGSSQMVLVLDGLDECEEDSLRQLLDFLREYLAETQEKARLRLKVIVLSRPQSGLLEDELRSFRRIKLDDSDTEVGKDVEKYISAKVAELASEKILSAARLEQIRQVLMSHADGTFLWVGFVANELKGRSWQKANDILHSVPKGLAGLYRRLLERVEDKEKLVTILQWVVLAARPMTLGELATAAEIKASDTLTPVEVLRDRLASCGLLVKVDGDVVNLVHESAREFFQSDQVNTGGIKMFHMNRTAHQTLLRTCLTLLEETYKSPGSISTACLHNSLLTYACLYWPEHFRHAFDEAEASSEFSCQFFQAESAVREDWWGFYWEREHAGGAPPSFTLLHLAAYFGHVAWARTLLEKNNSNDILFRRCTSRKDSLGRTPLFWAVARGHKDMVELLLDHGANINTRDQSKLTPLHVAVSGGNKELVSLLLRRSAKIEEKASYGETPLIRAILANSKDIVQLLLEHGARVDGLPTPPGVAVLKAPMVPPQELAGRLLELHEQLIDARHKVQSRQIDIFIKISDFFIVLFPPIWKLAVLSAKHTQRGRWATYNDTSRTEKWTQSFTKHGTRLIQSRNPKHLTAALEVIVQTLEVISKEDLEPLLVIGIMSGSNIMLSLVQQQWKEGVKIVCRTANQLFSLAHRSGTEESVDYGIRQFLIDCDDCIRSGRRVESANRMVVLFSTHLSSFSSEDPWPAKYTSTVFSEFLEGYIGGDFEEQVFNDYIQSWAHELDLISESRSSRALSLLLSSIMQLINSATEKVRDWFLNVPPAACQTLCRNNPGTHAWLMGEGIPAAMSTLIARQLKGPTQKRGFRALMECMIIGKQYGLSLPAAVLEKVKLNLDVIIGVDEMLDQLLG